MKACFVSSATALVRHVSIAAALSTAKSGDLVHLECECGCREPASHAKFRARESGGRIVFDRVAR